MTRAVALIATVALLGVAIPGTAWAYLDAGTGSMILQVIIAGVAGGLITLKIYWARIRARFFGERVEEKPAPDKAGNEPT